MTKQEQRDAWLYIAAGVLVALVALAAVYPVYATDRPGIPSTPRTGENIPSTTVDTLSASSSSATANPIVNANSGGGQSSSNLYSSDESRAFAIGLESPIPYGATPECYVPGNGFKRGLSVALGVVQLSAVLERDEQCIADVQAARAHQERMATLRLETIRAQAEASKASTEAYKASSQRALAECGWEEICAASK